MDNGLIVRGGSSGPNYSPEHIAEVKAALRKAKLPETIMVDCSHGNSSKNHRNQPKVADSIAQQLIDGEDSITGVMLESHLHEGRQEVPAEGKAGLKYGVSITDACIGWEDTKTVLETLANVWIDSPLLENVNVVNGRPLGNVVNGLKMERTGLLREGFGEKKHVKKDRKKS